MRKLTPDEEVLYRSALSAIDDLGLFVVQRKVKDGRWDRCTPAVRGKAEAYKLLEKKKASKTRAEFRVMALPIAEAEEECYNILRRAKEKKCKPSPSSSDSSSA